MASLEDTLEALGIGGADSSSYTPETIATRRKMAMAMLQGDNTPIKGTAAGIDSVLKKMIGAYQLSKLDKADEAGKKEAENLLTQAFLPGGDPVKGPSGFTTATAPVSASGGVREPTKVDLSDPLTLIKQEEGFAPTAKWDKRQYSGGYGSKAAQGETFTREKAEEYLRRDAAAPIAWVDRNVPNATPGQRAALVSFGYNLGTDDLNKLLPDIQKGDWNRVGQRMLSFNKAIDEKTGRLEVLDALTSRRRREAALLQDGAGGAGGSGGGTPPAGTPPGTVMASQAETATIQRALMLMRNPRTAPIGEALLKKAALAEAKDENQPPMILKVPGPDGAEVPMVFNRQTRQLDPISSIMSAPGGMPAAENALQPIGGPQGSPVAPEMAPPSVSGPALSPAAPAPSVPASAPIASPPLPERAPEPVSGAQDPLLSLAQAGPSLGGVNRGAKADMLPPSRPVAPVQVAAADTPAPVRSDAPPPAAGASLAGYFTGPQYRGKIQDGYIQRQAPGGGFLYLPDRKPALELKSAADARAKADEKRGEAQVEGDVQREGVRNIINTARQLTAQPGFDTALKLGRADLRVGLPYMGEVSMGDTFADPIARAVNSDNPVWGVKDDIRATQERLKAIIARPLFKGQGQVSDSERKMIAQMIGNLDRATSRADFQFRLNSVERMIDDMYAGKKLGEQASYSARPTTKEMLLVYAGKTPENIEAGVQELARKYNVPRDDMADYVMSQFKYSSAKQQKKQPEQPEATESPEQQSSVLRSLMARMGL